MLHTSVVSNWWHEVYTMNPDKLSDKGHLNFVSLVRLKLSGEAQVKRASSTQKPKLPMAKLLFFFNSEDKI